MSENWRTITTKNIEMTSVEQVKARYRQFAERECRGYSDLYFTLANAVADDDEIVSFIQQMPETQPNLFFASIQYLVGLREMPRSHLELREVINDFRDGIRQLMVARRTQTNEVGRCTAILPALPSGRLAVLEVGASAGLCLLLDRFHYDYGVRQVGDARSCVRLQCRTDNACLVPVTMPEIAWRGGIDLSPIDVLNDADVKWLLACVWPEHVERRERLSAAIQLAQTERPFVRQGNLASDLPKLLAEVPSELQLVIFHSAVFPYVGTEDRKMYFKSLVDASRNRMIISISNEGRSVVSEITALAPEEPQIQPTPFYLGRTTFFEGARKDEFLAFAHAHGAWLLCGESEDGSKAKEEFPP